jgi:hypothetical protein
VSAPTKGPSEAQLVEPRLVGVKNRDERHARAAAQAGKNNNKKKD